MYMYGKTSRNGTYIAYYFTFCMKKLPIEKAKVICAGKKFITEYDFFPSYEKELKNI